MINKATASIILLTGVVSGYAQGMLRPVGPSLDTLSLGPVNTSLRFDWSYRRNGEKIGMAGMHVGDTNGDGRQEIIASSQLFPDSAELPGDNWFVMERQPNGTYDKTYTSEVLPHRFKDLTVGDVNADGCTDIIIIHNNTILSYDGNSKSLIGAFAIPGGLHGTLHCGNIDLDAEDEIMFTLVGSGVYICNTQQIERFIPVNNCGPSVSTGQVLPDRDRELMVSGHGTTYIFNGRRGDLIAVYPDFGGYVQPRDLDGDGTDEVYCQSGPWLRMFRVGTYRSRVWEVLLTSSEPIEIGDVTGDGNPELIALHNSNFLLLDPFTGTEIEIRDPEGVHPMSKMALGKLDGTAGMKFVITSHGSGGSPLTVIDAESNLVDWIDRPHGSPFASVEIADINQDGISDLLYAPELTGQNRGCWTVRDGVLKLIRIVDSGTFGGGFGPLTTTVRAANIDSDPQLEVFVGGNRSINSFDGVTGAHQWSGQASAIVRDFTIHDLEGDGTLEVITVSSSDSQSSIEVYNAHTGVRLQRVFLPAVQHPIAVRVANIDAESTNEIVIGYRNSHVRILDALTRAVESSFNVAATAMDVFDDNGDGQSDIYVAEFGHISRREPVGGGIIASYGTYTAPVQALKVGNWRGESVSLAFMSGNRISLVYQEVGGEWTARQSASTYTFSESFPQLAVADSDGDGLTEIFFGTITGVSLYEIAP